MNVYLLNINISLIAHLKSIYTVGQIQLLQVAFCFLIYVQKRNLLLDQSGSIKHCQRLPFK